jgi:hypothetical protein
VAGSCEYGAETFGSGATELVSYSSCKRLSESWKVLRQRVLCTAYYINYTYYLLTVNSSSNIYIYIVTCVRFPWFSNVSTATMH